MVPTQGSIKVSYDEAFDVLEIFVQPPRPSITVKVEEDVYLHLVPEQREVIGMTIHRFRERNSNYMLPFEGHLQPTTMEMKERLERALVPA